MAKTDKPGVFISYSKHDVAMMQQLAAHLSNLEADLWHDRKLVGGDLWAEVLDERLNTAEIILLLVSHHFFASDFCRTIELPRALERGRAKDAKVIPVILSDCDWENSPVSQFQIHPSNRTPIESWEKPNEGFKDVVNGIRKAIAEIRPQTELSEQPKKHIPKEKLPYLCDRSEQEDKLTVALREHLKTKASRPVVCLVHGDVREAHNEFLERLRSYWLPDFLKTGSGVRKHVLETPNDDSPQTFWGKIGKVMGEGHPVAKEEVWPYIARHAEPLMFVLNLRMRETAARCESVVNSLLRFCHEDWDDLSAGRFVMFFVCVKYEEMGWMEFKKKSLQTNLQQMLARLADDQLREDDGIRFSDYSKVTGFVLPELKAVNETHVDEWSQKHFPLPDKKIRDLLKNGSLTMEEFAEEFEKLINATNK